MSWRQVVTLNEPRHPGVPVIHLSLACNHCADAPCMEHCPALAYSRDPETGIVTLHEDRCIGCRYCSWACPFDAPKFDGEGGVMTKCTFCSHRQEQGLRPACVEQCPTGALGFGDLAALPGAARAPGFPATACDPSIRFVPQPPVLQAVELTVPGDLSAAAHGSPPSKISLRSEWPLVGFTLLAAALVATVAASAAGAPAPHPAVFLGLAALSMGFSSLHLGRKLRAWRAVLNVRRSWLSREVVLYSGFVGLAAIHLVLAPDQHWLSRMAAAVGFAALFAVDRVYDIVRPPRMRVHGVPLQSADVVLTGGLGTVLLLGHLPLAVFFAAVKLVLYLARQGWRRAGRGWGLLRMTSGFVVPVAMGLADPTRWPVWALAGTAVAELVDRCQLYEELEVPTPRGQMAVDLERLLGSSVRASRALDGRPAST